MEILEACFAICRKKPGAVVFPDGEDIRAVLAAKRLRDEGLAYPLLVGRPLAVRQLQQQAGGGSSIAVVDQACLPFWERNAADYQRIQKAAGKDVTEEEAMAAMRSPLAAGAMMVRRGEVELGIGGNVSSTTDMLRAGLRIIGKQEKNGTVSSFFFMLSPKQDKLYIFTDCAVIPEPTSRQLAHIAIDAGRTFQNLIRREPRIALLSFSTKGSADHPRTRAVREALEEAKALAPDLHIDGELQLDAALVPEVGKQKAPGSSVAGQANVFVFPSLDAGNIGYKIAQRLGGYTALGPFLQGLAGGWHDLSRGCSADDMYQVTAVGLGLRRGTSTEQTPERRMAWMHSE